MTPLALERIVSGGQTGVDRAALDAALALGIPCGGWCPRGRQAEDGEIPARYPLRETAGGRHSERTKRNVVESDATWILNRGPLEGGTALTLRWARRLERPHRVVPLDAGVEAALAAERRSLRDWLARQGVRVLNVAGPRESGRPGIGAEALAFLLGVLGE